MTADIIPLPPIEEVRGYSIEHVALYLGTSRPKVYDVIRSGALPSITIGKRRVISGSALKKFLTGEKQVLEGAPIDPRMSALGRRGGEVGGLAKARNQQKKTTPKGRKAQAIA